MTSKIKVDNINKVSDDSNIIKKCGTTITLGASGDTIALASGASQTGFGRTGTVDWITTPKTATFSAVSGEGYFCNTSGGAFTVNLPAGTAGAIVSFADYTRTFQTNNLTIASNGSEKIGGVLGDFVASTEGQSITLVYVDATEGWINTAESTGQAGLLPVFITATGGTPTTVGDYKIHTFTGPGTFTVTCAGNVLGSDTVDYLVVAGGAGGTARVGGGGGAGGYRESSGAASGCYTASPLGACVSALPVSVQGYTVTVGAGGAGGTPSGSETPGSAGAVSTFSTITSAGGGIGMGGGTSPCGGAGGSGGGGGPSPGNPNVTGGAGNTPPVSPPQGNSGGPSGVNYNGGGGGGATIAGQAAGPTPANPVDGGGDGGNGATSSINNTPTTRAGGGGGGSWVDFAAGPGGEGGSGGGGYGPPGSSPTNPLGPKNAVTNTGGGGGGSGHTAADGGNGGSGIIVIRYKFQ